MKLSPIFCRIVAVAVMTLAPGRIVRASDVVDPPSNEKLYQSIYLGRTPLVETRSYIDGDSYLLKIEMKDKQPANVPASITVGLGPNEYEIPRAWFALDRISDTTHLFKLRNHKIGFALRYGSGERTRQRLFRIDFRRGVVKWEDWSPYDQQSFGKREAQSKYARLNKE